MPLVPIVAVLTTVISVAVKVVGMPDQIRANFRRKSTEGLSGWFIVCTLISYSMWVIYGFLTRDMTLVIGQGLGVVATGVILWQVIIYRKTTTKTPKSKPIILWYSALLQRTKAQTAAKTLDSK